MNEIRADAHRLAQQLLGAAHSVESDLERAVQEASGLSLAQLDFLENVAEGGGSLSLGKVAEGLACVRSNVTQLADRLEAQGAIRREDHPEDRRCVCAVVTEEGRRRLDEGRAARSRVERRIFGESGDGEMARLLERIQAGAGASG